MKKMKKIIIFLLILFTYSCNNTKDEIKIVLGKSKDTEYNGFMFGGGGYHNTICFLEYQTDSLIGTNTYYRARCYCTEFDNWNIGDTIKNYNQYGFAIKNK